jgi:hypothetical protein
MKQKALLLIAALSMAGTVASAPVAAHKDVAPRFGIELPTGYRESLPVDEGHTLAPPAPWEWAQGAHRKEGFP